MAIKHYKVEAIITLDFEEVCEVEHADGANELEIMAAIRKQIAAEYGYDEHDVEIDNFDVVDVEVMNGY